MSKKNKLFSWFGFNKKNKEDKKEQVTTEAQQAPVDNQPEKQVEAPAVQPQVIEDVPASDLDAKANEAVEPTDERDLVSSDPAKRDAEVTIEKSTLVSEAEVSAEAHIEALNDTDTQDHTLSGEEDALAFNTADMLQADQMDKVIEQKQVPTPEIETTPAPIIDAPKPEPVAEVEQEVAPEVASEIAPEVIATSEEAVQPAENTAEKALPEAKAGEAISETVQTPTEIKPEPVVEPVEPVEPAKPIEKEKPAEKQGFFSRLKQGLLKTKQNIGSGFASLFSGKKIDDELFEELETQLLVADVGIETTTKIIDNLTDHADRKQLKDGDALYGLLQQELADMLEQVDKPLVIKNDNGPFVILMVGVNGVGKTTTIGKLAKQYQAQGHSVMLAAGDTFRAAAVEQLQVWGERNDIPVIAQHTGADSASVIYDAFEAAKARKVDVLIADTAGRLQNKAHLMDELSKIVRVMKKLDPNAPHEIMLTIDAATGQNAISQTQLFNDAVGLTGITLTKLDGTAKGGVIFAVADKFDIPIRYIGVGEGIDDLREFKSNDFIKALFDREL
ncbi:signal recognition particle-docking protein FtsY [Flocculibacter collagenilyticus]|uniref:signal recognition particle-docking protein FtsY n=1 Tax=Flocculibacter collagenilyticus TaxID=2744479 RepID=UPI0018F2EADE|nr:signal recognition particle-docking protein FtsY [Flocculibacter collagenilyticus]